jgi:predicted metal-dependent phosphoesterase TrpH
MRCDLHVHSRFSGRCTVPVLRHFVDESHSEPEEVYAQARRRGMDLVTLTDHDTITGALAIAGRPDTFISEEVTCWLPDGRQLHLGVYDLDEDQHERIAARRSDAEALFACLAEQRLAVSLNHPFSALTGHRRVSDLELGFANVSLVEGRNGMLPAGTNEAGAAAALREGLGMMGGSDAHTLRSVARAFTVVPGARNRNEFLAGLRRGLTLPAGTSGSYARFTRDLVSIAANAYRAALRPGGAPSWGHAAALLAAAPLLPLLPVVAGAIWYHEQAFAARHYALYTDRFTATVPRPPAVSSAPAAA